jgi:hypothetical protein
MEPYFENRSKGFVLNMVMAMNVCIVSLPHCEKTRDHPFLHQFFLGQRTDGFFQVLHFAANGVVSKDPAIMFGWIGPSLGFVWCEVRGDLIFRKVMALI